ncbi:biotin synthase BioB [Paenibacillus apiarius]|uniref:Biotin synthase n=1 Tax=Paenibacillus apiarius TaxID=46240 RepID=A0ABT4E0P2_9BACL|nr:biotin synthase BioB [Paenibacillus apiarius]MBN3524912.1 biotin synthase BioB [Paenibacillus apiarius]MCY9516790.1 biotin synthase BioB [Paenibacillus apiarius]MCY9523167.1 biotin synthase BioB [Paenibacillus apiarius]MCY9555474.1 biotin synthase BioB [Paenibacillus apiarius]MCY9559656.1 biotin synthase BioB [Paenibacillus apiarius]
MSDTTTMVETDWRNLAIKAIQGEVLSREEALSVLRADDEELLAIMDAAYRVRRHFFGNKVKLNLIINAKSGYCPEDCGYCSQSRVSDAPIEKYTMLEKDVLVDGAKKAMAMQAGTYCIVASGRGPTPRELDQVVAAVEEIKSTLPMKICACLGILSQEQANRLKQAGVDRYNHNLNTSKDHYSHITSTHTYTDRIHTVETAKHAGMSPCSGVIMGMGETDDQLVDVAFSLRELDADSIPINFLNPIPGTPLAHLNDLDPRRCLKAIAMFRFVCPSKEIRASGGREVNLGMLQPLALYAANSVFVGDYLTTEGQEATADHKMIEDLGFEIEQCAL